MTVEVQLISATWCKRCHTLLPDITMVCSLAGARLTYIDMDEMDEDDPLRNSITALPTIRMRVTADDPWNTWTAATYEDWKSTVMTTALRDTLNTDF